MKLLEEFHVFFFWGISEKPPLELSEAVQMESQQDLPKQKFRWNFRSNPSRSSRKWTEIFLKKKLSEVFSQDFHQEFSEEFWEVFHGKLREEFLNSDGTSGATPGGTFERIRIESFIKVSRESFGRCTGNASGRIEETPGIITQETSEKFTVELPKEFLESLLNKPLEIFLG